ncbi:hypothetical protein [Actinospica robiniae]|uniref:hypothetical protein n=1 Tax=Actinospica robiniae TaxID=304901 RepID=UPI0012F9B60F|nr:hypothetical protein [Actinospica robiniae]
MKRKRAAACARVLALIVLGALVWAEWYGKGPSFGIPVALGFGYWAARAAVPRSRRWAIRHRALADIGVYVSVVTVVLWFGAWRSPTVSAGPATAGAAGAVTGVALLDWWSRFRKARAARRELLATLASDLRLLQVRAAAAAAETARPGEPDRAEAA